MDQERVQLSKQNREDIMHLSGASAIMFVKNTDKTFDIMATILGETINITAGLQVPVLSMTAIRHISHVLANMNTRDIHKHKTNGK